MYNLTTALFHNQDLKYKSFQQKIVPDTKYPLIGVRLPKIREIAKVSVKRDYYGAYEFLSQKHDYYDEYMLHAFLISELKKDFSSTINLIEDFLPYIDSWGICDSLVCSLKIFKKHKVEVFNKVKDYLKSPHPYTVRFGIVVLLNYFLDEEYFEKSLIVALSNSSNGHYYVDMAIAWLYSVALTKDFDKALFYLQNNDLTDFVYNTSIQKAIDSYRISLDNKKLLKSLKRK